MAQKQPFLERVRNSSLVEQPRADNEAGLSMAPKPRNRRMSAIGRGAFRGPVKANPRGALEETEERMQA